MIECTGISLDDCLNCKMYDTVQEFDDHPVFLRKVIDVKCMAGERSFDEKGRRIHQKGGIE